MLTLEIGTLFSSRIIPFKVAVCVKLINGIMIKRNRKREDLIFKRPEFYFLKNIVSNVELFPTLSVTIIFKLFSVSVIILSLKS